MQLTRILVTGGAGFIGSHTVNFLLAQGKQVVVLDNLSSGKINNLDMTHPNLKMVEGDVLEFPLLEDVMIGCDAVLHFAAVASVPLSMENPVYSFQVNTQGFLHVLQAIHRSRRSIRLVYASSAAVYGDATEMPCSDMKLLRGKLLSPYALQKLNNEEYAALYQRLHDIQSLGLRYFNVYGSRQDPASPYSGVISYFMDAYKKDIELTVFGDGRQSRDFIYVDDVVKANWLALHSQLTGVLNIATGIPQTLLQLISCIETAGKKAAKRRFGSPRPGDIHTSYADVEAAAQQLAFRYAVPLQEGISKLLMARN